MHWNQSDWLLAGGLGAATAGSSVFDAMVRRNTGHIPDRFFNQWQNFGAQYSFLVLSGFEAWGVIGDTPRARSVAMDGLTASVIAGGIVTPSIKYGVGRVRPNATARTFAFKPFSGNLSFPSGHVTQAFAIATVIADHYDAWWQQSLAYGTVALVGWGRIDSNSHFLSDVVGGAAIGWAVGHAVVQRHNTPPEAKVTLHFTPWSDGQQTGFILSRRF